MREYTIKEADVEDREWIRRFLIFEWGAEIVVAHDIIYYPADLPGFVAIDKEGKQIGLITYRIDGDQCEIITMNSLREGMGVGTALIEKVKTKAINSGCRRLWLVTTNDNLTAIRYYQKRGFRIVKVHSNSMIRARKKKPEIPEIGHFDIPVQDELEFEMILQE